MRRCIAAGVVCLLCHTLPPSAVLAQSFTSSGPITVANGNSSPYPSTIAVSNLSGTLTAITVTLSNFSVSNANSWAAVLQSPDGTHNLDLLSGVCDISNGSTFTLSDTGTHGLLPAATNANALTLSGSYKATDYFPGQDTFPSPGPVTTYTSAGDGIGGSGTGTFLNTFGDIAATNFNGTWKLFGADQVPSFPTSGSIGSWTLSFTVISAPATITTLDAPTPNPAFTSGANSLVTITAHVNKADDSGPATNGAVTFHDNTLSADIGSAAVDASGTASLAFTFTNDGNHTLVAAYGGSANFAPGTPSGTLIEAVSTHTVVTGGNIYKNPATLTINDGNSTVGVGGTPYPSLIFVGTNGAPSLPGIIQALTVTLNNINYEDLESLGFILVGPDQHAFEFMAFAGGDSSGSPVSLTFDDRANSSLQVNIRPPSGTFLPTSLLDEVVSTDPYPLPAPQSFNSAAPTGTATLTTEFGGLNPNGTWQLFEANRASGTGVGSISGWWITFTIFPPDLSIASSHTMGFCQGQIEDFTVIVTNRGSGLTGGAIPAMAVDTLPMGLTPILASGSGWTCAITNQIVTCITSNSTAPGTSYPPITITVSVATNAPASLTNTAVVSGSNDNTPGDNTATDRTVISPVPAASIELDGNPCPGSSFNIAFGPTGATSYLWSITNGVITSGANTRNITYSAGSSGMVGLTLQIANAAGCSASNSVVAGDTVRPTVICSSNITVTASGYCPVVVNFNVSASDNCTLAGVVATPASGSAFPVGANIVNVVATDAAGNTNTCSFIVTVLAGAAPQLAAVSQGTNVVLAWPSAAGCYALQSSPTLLPFPSSNVWTTYTGPRITNAGTIFVTNGIVVTNRFYRLSFF